MSLECAVDKLCQTGWVAADDANGCERLPDGRLYPSVIKVQATFLSRGYGLVFRQDPLFDCCRAVWVDRTGAAAGAVVGGDQREAALYALTQLRRTAPVVSAKMP